MEFAARISGTGSAFPARRITNDDISRELTRFGQTTNNQWIQERTGIIERRISNVQNEAETNSSLGARAARAAMKMAGRNPEDIDQIIYATCSPDTLLPSTACWLQQKIGARNAWAMDINAACSGFVYGVVTAEQFILSGRSKTILVVGGEILSQFVNWQDRTICILFGDGAGAAVVEQAPTRSSQRILSSYLSSDGNLSKLFHIPAGGSTLEVTPERYEQNLHKMHMNGRELFKVAVRTLSGMRAAYSGKIAYAGYQSRLVCTPSSQSAHYRGGCKPHRLSDGKSDYQPGSLRQYLRCNHPHSFG